MKIKSDDYDVEKIRRAVRERGWVQYRLAKEAEVSPVTVSKLYSGGRVTETTMKKIVDALGLEMKDVLPAVEEATA